MIAGGAVPYPSFKRRISLGVIPQVSQVSQVSGTAVENKSALTSPPHTKLNPFSYAEGYKPPHVSAEQANIDAQMLSYNSGVRKYLDIIESFLSANSSATVIKEEVWGERLLENLFTSLSPQDSVFDESSNYIYLQYFVSQFFEKNRLLFNEFELNTEEHTKQLSILLTQKNGLMRLKGYLPLSLHNINSYKEFLQTISPLLDESSLFLDIPEIKRRNPNCSPYVDSRASPAPFADPSKSFVHVVTGRSPPPASSPTLSHPLGYGSCQYPSQPKKEQPSCFSRLWAICCRRFASSPKY